MIKLVQTSKGISIDVQSKAKSKRQRLAIQQLVEQNDLRQLVSYLSSFGRREYGNPRHISIQKIKSSGRDVLADKQSGTVKALFDKMFDTDRSHTPHSAQRDWIGVEIECLIPNDFDSECEEHECGNCCGSGLVYDCNDDEIDCGDCGGSGHFTSRRRSGNKFSILASLFRERKIKFSSIKSDGSIREENGFFACEITVLTRLSEPSNLKLVCSLLNEIGAKVNKSCGMHVHLDMRHETEAGVKAIGSKFKRALPVLLSMVPQTRRSNSYCVADVSGLKGGRYYAVNLTAFRKYKTVEIRLHSSTTDFKKIFHWAQLLSCIANGARAKRVVSTIMELTEFVYVPEETLEFVSQRTALFSPDLSGSLCSESYQDNDSTEQIEQIGA